MKMKCKGLVQKWGQKRKSKTTVSKQQTAQKE